MSGQEFDREERDFVKAVGLDAHDLEWLVPRAPVVPADVAERVLQKARLKTGRRLWRLRQWGAAAAAIIVVVGVTAALSHQPVQAAIRGWILPIPGLDVTEMQPDIWCSLLP